MHEYKLTIATVDLVLRDDDLAGVRVIGARNGVLEQADGPNDLALLDDTHLSTLNLLASAEVAGITNDLLGLDGLTSAADPNELAIRVSDNLVNGLVEHVSSTIDGRKTSERLGQFAETVERVDVGGFAISGHGRGVEDDAVVGGTRGLRDVTRDGN